MTLITSDCGAARPPEHQMALSTSGSVPSRFGGNTNPAFIQPDGDASVVWCVALPPRSLLHPVLLHASLPFLLVWCVATGLMMMMMMMISVYLTHRRALTHGNGCSHPRSQFHTRTKAAELVLTTPPFSSLCYSVAFTAGLPFGFAGPRCRPTLLPCWFMAYAVCILTALPAQQPDSGGGAQGPRSGRPRLRLPLGPQRLLRPCVVPVLQAQGTGRLRFTRLRDPLRVVRERPPPFTAVHSVATALSCVFTAFQSAYSGARF